MAKGKSGPKPKTQEELAEIARVKAAKAAEVQAAKEAKAKEKADAKAAKEKAEADAKAEKEAAKAAAKAEREAAKAAKIGHNSEMTEEEQRGVLVKGVAEIIDLQGQVATLTSKIRDWRKKLNANGFGNAEVNFAIKLRKSEDEEADQSEWHALVRVALFMNHPIGTQPDLFYQAGDGVDRTPSVDKAFEAGKMVGMEAKQPCSPPSHYGQEQAQQWILGWQEGQAVHARAGFNKLEPTLIKPAEESAQSSFDDALDDAPGDTAAADDEKGGDDFMPSVPDHAGDPRSPANPNNRLN